MPLPETGIPQDWIGIFAPNAQGIPSLVIFSRNAFTQPGGPALFLQTFEQGLTNSRVWGGEDVALVPLSDSTTEFLSASGFMVWDEQLLELPGAKLVSYVYYETATGLRVSVIDTLPADISAADQVALNAWFEQVFQKADELFGEGSPGYKLSGDELLQILRKYLAAYRLKSGRIGGGLGRGAASGEFMGLIGAAVTAAEIGWYLGKWAADWEEEQANLALTPVVTARISMDPNAFNAYPYPPDLLPADPSLTPAVGPASPIDLPTDLAPGVPAPVFAVLPDPTGDSPFFLLQAPAYPIDPADLQPTDPNLQPVPFSGVPTALDYSAVPLGPPGSGEIQQEGQDAPGTFGGVISESSQSGFYDPNVLVGG